MTNDELLFKILRISLGVDDGADFPDISAEEWERLYEQADRQTLLGIAYEGVTKLAAAKRPPMDIMFQWGSEAESIRGWNKLLNAECIRLTNLFEEEKFATAILKGQANARLYPNPLLRQPGDIDIWVGGGKEKIADLLNSRNLMKEAIATAHHFHMFSENPDVDIEIHYRPSSGNLNLFSTRRILRYLNRELENRELVPEGFYVPSIKFALVMQLSHIQRHFFQGGVGLRQLVDYFMLLRFSMEQDRREVAPLLKRFGLFHIAGALMWLLREVLRLDESLMICEPDARRGRFLLENVLRQGNFGRHEGGKYLKWLFWWLNKRRKSLRHFYFDPVETLWAEINYWITFARNTSVRIRLRKVSLRNVNASSFLNDKRT